jgi:peptidoglycan hydrolase-like protein with peptidoglycan-binding domain
MIQKFSIRTLAIGLMLLFALGPILAEAGMKCYEYRYAYNLVRGTQQRLEKNGFNPGSIDGIWGSKTRTAVRQFQRNEGLEVTSELDETTLRTLFGNEYVAGGVTIIENPLGAPQDVFDKYCK